MQSSSKSNVLGSIYRFGIFTVILGFGLVFILLSNKKSVPKTTVDAMNQPVVSSPLQNAIVTSPLSITGTVPQGWMFEGSFPIDMVDENRNPIVTGSGHDVPPGSWTNGGPVRFEATLTFTTAAKSGYVILHNDNPSGMPENAKSFEIPIRI